jgi:hypothetical protein
MKKESLFIRILRDFKTDSEGYPIAGLEGSPVRYSSTYRRNQPGFDNLNYALAYDIQVTKDLLMGHQSGRLSVVGTVRESAGNSGLRR